MIGSGSLLLEKGIDEAKIVDFITNQDRVNGILRYYDSEDLKNILKFKTYEDRLKFLDQFGTVNKLDNTLLGRLEGRPSLTELLFGTLKPGTAGLDVYTAEDALKLLKSQLNDNILAYLITRNKLLWKDVTAAKSGIKYIKAEIPELIQLNDLNTNYLTGSKLIKEFKGLNRLYCKIDTYLAGNPVGETLERNFIAGSKDYLKAKIFDKADPALKDLYIEPDYSLFDKFKIKAYDSANVDRFNDTEMKFVYDFLANSYQDGDRFVITIESVLYNCTNCQRYLQALKKYAANDGKFIEINFIAHPEAIGDGDVKRLITPQQ